MNKTLFIMVFLLMAFNVAARDQYRECAASYPSDDSLFLYNFPYWVEVGEIVPLYISNFDVSNNNYAHISIAGSPVSNMTYISSSNLFRSYITSASEEDVNLSINIYNSSWDLLANCSDTLRFRNTFNVSMDFFKNVNSTSTDTEAYDNEFQYAVLRLQQSGVPEYSYELSAPNTNKFLNALGSIFPYYKKIDETTDIPVTQEVYLWARLDDGNSGFKVYENGTYDLYVINTDLYGGLTSLYEFGLPVRNDQLEFRSTIAGDISIDNETNTSYNVFISAWEVYKWNLLKNFAKIILLLIVWGLVSFGIAFVMTFWLPAEMQSRAFAYALGGFALTTSPLLVMAVRLLWT